MKWKSFLILLTGMLLVAAGGVVAAQSGGGYDLTWNSVDGGGSTSSGGGYTLVGTAGQPDAGQLEAGTYVLGGGFWKGGVVVSMHEVYLPCVVRSRQ
jgi:hypothetical protein